MAITHNYNAKCKLVVCEPQTQSKPVFNAN